MRVVGALFTPLTRNHADNLAMVCKCRVSPVLVILLHFMCKWCIFRYSHSLGENVSETVGAYNLAGGAYFLVYAEYICMLENT